MTSIILFLENLSLNKMSEWNEEELIQLYHQDSKGMFNDKIEDEI